LAVLAASRVAMTAMPEMVALLNSFVGLAAVLVGFAEYCSPQLPVGIEETIHRVEIYAGVPSSAWSPLPDRWWPWVSYRALCPAARCCSRPAMFDHFHAGVHGSHLASLHLGYGYLGLVLLGIMTAICADIRHRNRHGDRWGRYGGGDLHAQQLLRLGFGGGGLYAVTTTC
jgi:hypothetical protein